MSPKPTATRPALALLAALPLASCGSLYYGTMEKFGVHKRDILADRVEEGREAQAEAKEQFQSALEAFQSVTSFDGGDLEQVYGRLNDEFEDAEDRAAEVSDRIRSIEKVATALFDEWAEELGEMQNENLRRDSERMKAETEDHYASLIGAMKKAESRMEPVLSSFRDHVLFLKHNLNARAIASLQGELRGIETDVDALIADMNASIAEADEFLATMG